MGFVRRKRGNSQRNKVLFSSATEHWQTPDDVIALVRQLGPIILDPCAAQDERDWVGERNFNGLNGDGLHESWKVGNGHAGVVYGNFPYSVPVLDEFGEPMLNAKGNPKRENVIQRWAEKALVESREGVEIIMLTPSRTDTAWFHDVLCYADARCFWRGRMKFKLPGQKAENSATFPSLITYFGPHRRLFWETFRHRGRVEL